MSYDLEIRPRTKRRWPLALVVIIILIAGGGAYLVINRNLISTGGSPVTDQVAQIYHCPMHPTYTADKPGECPICGMNLVPIEDQREEAHKHEARPQPKDRAAIRVTSTQRQAIGVKTAKVGMHNLTKDIRTVGTVAFDPKLVVAQREYLTARRLGDRALWKAAEERLYLMGMSRDQIKQIARQGRVQKNLYLPGPDNKAWIYAVIYEVDIPYVKKEQTVSITVPGSPLVQLSGTIASIDPVLDPKTRTVTIRSEVADPGGLLKPNRYVNVSLKIPLGELLSIPTSALLWSENTHFVFVDDGEGRLVPRKVAIGKRTDDYVEIKQGLNEGELVVVQPNFLFDAESQLKATLKEMGGKGGHKH